ncbi:MAG: DUF4065 domain-containing protein [Phormidesmis sp. CAN_BIN44]|nr:DUF4065 domain-containing protein [Phormidesmis sp. CAN_BIN44]
MKRATDVAHYFLKRVNGDPEKAISPLKLQKLLYYAQAWNLVFLGKPLFVDTIQAWVNGPVVYAVWSLYQGNQPIAVPSMTMRSVEFDQDETKVLQEVWDAYGSQTAEQLRELTHREHPWLSARCGLAPEEKSQNPILHEDMMLYYQTLLNQIGEPTCLKIPMQALNPDNNSANVLSTSSSPHESFESLSNLVQDLQMLQPLRRSSQQSQLARQALAALNDRKERNIQEWANNLARNVADAVD